MRVRLEYADQNRAFASCLPVHGQLGRSVDDTASRRWWVIELDEQLEYQHKVGEPHQYQLIQSRRLVVGSRVQGHEVGDGTPTPVHVYLPLGEEATAGTELDFGSMLHVAWGVIHAVDAV